ncbi:MAG TPA: FHA domain-containing protein [Polyangia bacterium]|nr:FHA domain-containing protein [Polyangia bacterium]
MIQCKHCGKENQDHYKFCLGCGVELSKPEPEPASQPEPDSAPATAPASALPVATPSPVAYAATPVPPTTPAPEPAEDWPPRGARESDAAAERDRKPASAPSSLDDGALFAHAAAATLEPPPEPRLRIPTPVPPLEGPALGHDTVKESGPPVFGPPSEPVLPLPPPEPPRTGSAPAPRATGPVDPTGPTAPPEVSPGTTCPSCGTRVPPGFMFCGACGARVAPAPAAAGAAPSAGGDGRPAHLAGGAAPARAPQVAPRGRLVLIRSDGSEGGVHPLTAGVNLIGRGQGAMFDGDAFLSPRHAEIAFSSALPVVRDLHSLNGVFIKMAQEEEMVSGTIFRIGQELLRFDAIPPPQPLEDGTELMGSPNPGFWGRLTVIVGRDSDGSAFPLFGDGVVLGRERGDILFPEDGYVSGTHARISYRDGKFYLADLGSSNGTFLRIRGERTLKAGSFLLMGQQLFKLGF